jgi:hypothetical protein
MTDYWDKLRPVHPAGQRMSDPTTEELVEQVRLCLNRAYFGTETGPEIETASQALTALAAALERAKQRSMGLT